MATTSWIGTPTTTHDIPDIGDWNTAADWTNGVPTAADDAVFPPDRAGPINGDGPAASITVEKEQTTLDPLGQPNPTALYSLGGTHALGTLAVASGATLYLGQALPPFVTQQGVPAVLSFGSALLEGGIVLTYGSQLGAGPITLAGGTIQNVTGTLANPIMLVGGPGSTGSIGAGNSPYAGDSPVLTITSPISGDGVLGLGGPSSGQGRLVLASAANTATGGANVQGTVEVAVPGALGTGPVGLSGSLTLEAGVTTGPVTGSGQLATVDASLAVFDTGGLSFANGSGRSTFVGTTVISHVSTAPEASPLDQGAFSSVTGGTGQVTVFAGNGGGRFFGGTGGHNLIVAGADLAGYTEIAGNGLNNFPGLRHFEDAQGTILTPSASTIGGGGSGDLLVATGTLDNLVAAAGGNETLTGSGASGNNTFFGGTGSDLIATGAGRDLVVAGSGAATIAGGAGNAAIFAGPGQDLILGGAGGNYIQAGAGAATVFTGAGADLLAVVSGQAGGSVTVSGFRVGTDHVAARGYAIGPTQTSAGGSTVLEFSDHTRVTLPGVASLPASAFV